MRKMVLGMMVSLFGCAAGAQTAQLGATHVHIEASGGQRGPVTVTAGNWLNAAPVQSQLIVGGNGQTYIGVWIDTPPGGPAMAQRAPLDLALVIDTSGSMSGEKIANARMAASSLLETLRDGDIVSLYGFSDSVREIVAPTTVTSDTRPALMQSVAQLQPMGGTNLFAGLTVGESRAAQAPASHPVRRVIVISDGMANIGPSSPEELGNVAAQGTESGVQVSAIGVGLEYDERTLGALAMRSAGRMYHLQDPSQMSAILAGELQRLSETVATDAYIDVEPADGVHLLGAESVPSQNIQGHVRIQLGSLFGGQHREVLIRANVDTRAAGDRPLGAARLVYRTASASHNERDERIPLHYSVTPDQAAAHRSVDARVQAMVASNQAAQNQLRAAQALSQGQSAVATQALDEAARELQVAAAAAPASPQRDRLMRQAASVAAGRHAASAPAASPAANRARALDINSDAMGAMGY